jgi:CBS domain-containing protein
MQTAKDIMTSKVKTIKATASVAEAMALMRENRIRDLVVVPKTQGDSYGILTETDIVYKVAAFAKDPNQVFVDELMTKPCLELDPDMTVQEVARFFANNHIHRAPVIKGELMGIVTVFDIIRETMWWQG